MHPIVYLAARGAAFRKNKNQRDSSQLRSWANSNWQYLNVYESKWNTPHKYKLY